MSVPDHLIEKAAKALAKHDDWSVDEWDDWDDYDRYSYMRHARAALEAVADELRAEGAHTCECCGEPTTRPYVHPVEGIDLCAPCAVSLMEPVVEAARAEGAKAEREKIADEIRAMPEVNPGCACGGPTWDAAVIAARVREGGDTDAQ